MMRESAARPTGSRRVELSRAADILVSITGDEEARRDAAFATMAELLRLGRADLAQALSADLRERLPADPETAFLPPDPPPDLSPATNGAFDDEHGGPVWPWAGTEAARARMVEPQYCAGLGATLVERGESDGWEWAEAGAFIASGFLAERGRAPRCEALGTFLAWLVAGHGRHLSAWTTPPELRHVWPASYPQAREFCRHNAQGRSPEETAHHAADLVAQADQRASEQAERIGQIIRAPKAEP